MKPNNKNEKWQEKKTEGKRVVNVSLYIPPFFYPLLGRPLLVFVSKVRYSPLLLLPPFFIPSLLSQLLLGRVETGRSAHSTLSSGVVHTHSQRRQQTHPDPRLSSSIPQTRRKGGKNNQPFPFSSTYCCFHSAWLAVSAPWCCLCVCVYAVISSFGCGAKQKQNLEHFELTWALELEADRFVPSRVVPTTTAAVILPYYIPKWFRCQCQTEPPFLFSPRRFLIHRVVGKSLRFPVINTNRPIEFVSRVKIINHLSASLRCCFPQENPRSKGPRRNKLIHFDPLRFVGGEQVSRWVWRLKRRERRQADCEPA